MTAASPTSLGTIGPVRAPTWTASLTAFKWTIGPAIQLLSQDLCLWLMS
jgi:hypothetical protein